jgi:hypothetical protein
MCSEIEHTNANCPASKYEVVKRKKKPGEFDGLGFF